jgi:Sigma-70 region 2
LARQPGGAFDGFMRGRWPAMVRLAYGLTGDAGHAEDIAQAAFARAYASWGRVRPSIALWLRPGRAAPPRGQALVLRLASTKIADSTGGPGGAGAQLGSAAPGVGLLRYTLSNGKSLDVTPVSWTAYSAADGRQVGHGKA